MRVRRELTVEERWAGFLARNDFACPNCGYNLRGLRATRCPECGRKIDAETAMYVGAPVKIGALWRTAISVWVVVGLNVAMVGAVWALVPALKCSRWAAHPPTEWYGLLILRMAWLAVFAAGVSIWWLDLKGARAATEGARWVLDLAPKAAVAMTGAHLLWTVGRFVL